MKIEIPSFAAWVAVGMLGIRSGTGLFTFHYGEGLSYFSKDPEACVNCHIMRPQFESWQKASHHGVATCVDCHLPHQFLGKWFAKAENGFWLSKGFTLQDFQEPIVLRENNKVILNANCINCHSELLLKSSMVTRPHPTMRTAFIAIGPPVTVKQSVLEIV